MRAHYEAFGRVCAAAIANGDDITMSMNERVSETGEITINIAHRDGVVFVSAFPNSEYLTLGMNRRYQNIEGFSVERLVHINEAEEALSEDEDLFGFDGSVQPITVENGQVELFDGISVRRPLYAYEDDFGIKEYRHALSDVVSRSRDIFERLSEELDIDMDVEGSASENQPSPSQSRSFQ